MRSPIAKFIAASVCVVTMTGCPPVDDALKHSVIFQYDHVAVVHEIRFGQNVTTSAGAIGSVAPKGNGFWAVFVICSLDVNGKALESFNYNIANFAVEFDGTQFGQPLQPGTLRYGASTAQNTVTDTPAVAAAIADTMQLGPDTQVFPRGLYPSLNYRVAILLPESLRNYRGEEMTLRYVGQPSILQGRGHRPADVQVLPADSSLPAGCRPPAH